MVRTDAAPRCQRPFALVLGAVANDRAQRVAAGPQGPQAAYDLLLQLDIQTREGLVGHVGVDPCGPPRFKLRVVCVVHVVYSRPHQRHAGLSLAPRTPDASALVGGVGS